MTLAESNLLVVMARALQALLFHPSSRAFSEGMSKALHAAIEDLEGDRLGTIAQAVHDDPYATPDPTDSYVPRTTQFLCNPTHDWQPTQDKDWLLCRHCRACKYIGDATLTGKP
jgi:hypothetical protein